MGDKEERGNRPEAQRRCVEDGFHLDDAVCRDFSLLQPEAILRQVLNQFAVRIHKKMVRGAARDRPPLRTLRREHMRAIHVEMP